MQTMEHFLRTNDPLATWSHKVTGQIESLISQLPQCL